MTTECKVFEVIGNDYSNDVGTSSIQSCNNETGLCEDNEEMRTIRRVPTTFNLVGIRTLISPPLLYALAAAGWKDEFVIVDSTFPAETYAHPKKIIRLDGMPILPLIKEIMNLWQLDRERPMALLFNEKVQKQAEAEVVPSSSSVKVN